MPWEVQWLNAKCAGLQIEWPRCKSWTGLTYSVMFLGKMLYSHSASLHTSVQNAVADPGGGSGGSGPPIRPDAYIFETAILTSTGSYITFLQVIFFMKCAWHFSIKLNLGIFKNVIICFWVPSYDLFASTCKAVFPALTTIGFPFLCYRAILIKILKNTYLLIGEMLQASQKLYKRKSFALLESILGRTLQSRFRRKTLFSQPLAMR